MRLARSGITAVALLACKGAANPTADADAAGIVTDVGGDACSLIEGIDDNAIVRTICAFVPEIISVIVPFIIGLRAADAGSLAKPGESCVPLPHSDLCTTSRERAKAVQHLVNVRIARLQLDGGAR